VVRGDYERAAQTRELPLLAIPTAAGADAARREPVQHCWGDKVNGSCCERATTSIEVLAAIMCTGRSESEDLGRLYRANKVEQILRDGLDFIKVP
jgi:hypothetical protein